MIKILKNFTKNPLFSGSLIMIAGSNAVNVLNYLYHLVMGRMLGPVGYGEIAALFSLLGLLGLMAVSFNLVVVKYVAAAEDKTEIGSLIKHFNGKVIIAALVIALLITVGSPKIALFLNVKNPVLVIMVAISFFIIVTTTLNRGILQGSLRFTQLVATFLVENGLKLILGVLMVYLGFSVLGAVFGLVIATLMAWYLSTRFIKGLTDKVVDKKIHLSPLFLYSIPVMLQTIAITSLYSSDLLLVKHFFAPQEAGIYASLSTLAKIIFFAAGPVSNVMFPLVSKKHSKGENTKNIFFYSLVLIFAISAGITLIYIFLPNLAINILFGSSYTNGASLLAWFAIFITFMTLSYFLVNFHLSMNKIRIVILPVIAAVLQIISIWFFYHQNLKEVIFVSVIVNGVLFLLIGIYTILSFKGEVQFHG